MAADGSFANCTFLRDIPERTTVVVHIPKNARLRKVLPLEERTGNRKYGIHLPTPEEMLADSAIPTRTIDVAGGGRTRTLSYKIVEDVC
jgi:hypothetical protein